jgi:hypothetical protein
MYTLEADNVYMYKDLCYDIDDTPLSLNLRLVP